MCRKGERETTGRKQKPLGGNKNYWEGALTPLGEGINVQKACSAEEGPGSPGAWKWWCFQLLLKRKRTQPLLVVLVVGSGGIVSCHYCHYSLHLFTARTTQPFELSRGHHRLQVHLLCIIARSGSSEGDSSAYLIQLISCNPKLLFKYTHTQ